MLCWRLIKQRRKGDVLSGEGSRLYGARWNHPGVSIIYAATTLSLAALEVSVHLDRKEADLQFLAVELYVPDAYTEAIDVESLPPGWRNTPSIESCKDLGSTWAREQRSLVLKVPSIIIPQEQNILLACDHPEMSRVKVNAMHNFTFDSRLWK
jgi:RES domain-containing protein